MSSDSAYRARMFQQIKEAPTKEAAQQAALELWHHLNSTQEGWICPGCANCALAEDDSCGQRQPLP